MFVPKMAPSYELSTITCSGSPRQMGHEHGEQLREPIQRFVQQRFDALREYMTERGKLDIEGFLACGRQCFDITRKWDPKGSEELTAIAQAAGVDPATLYAAGNMTDVRDVVLLGRATMPAELDEGCSAFVLPKALTREGQLHAAQTWDLNPGDIDFVVAVQRRPSDGPETWSVTCVGCLSLVGMNSLGLSVGTTNIKVADTQPGVGYLSLLHRALNSTSFDEARATLLNAPRAAAHTYWVADGERASEFECSARRVAERALLAGPLTRTNHCISGELRDLQAEETHPSSAQRLRRLGSELASGSQDVASIRRLFADRSDGLLSINRYLEDETGTSTNACIVCVPERREFWACRGPSDRGVWQRLEFRAN